ncbi:MAG: hypothetical protein MUO19_08935, partial [Dehalococcoidales bacterium]|nr:hypothetical protein [Dehalococcoidales bacterium]
EELNYEKAGAGCGTVIVGVVIAVPCLLPSSPVPLNIAAGSPDVPHATVAVMTRITSIPIIQIFFFII